MKPKLHSVTMTIRLEMVDKKTGKFLNKTVTNYYILPKTFELVVGSEYRQHPEGVDGYPGHWVKFTGYAVGEADESLKKEGTRKGTKANAKGRFLQKLRAAIVLAGGIEMSDDELWNKPLSEILPKCFGNGIKLDVRLTKIAED